MPSDAATDARDLLGAAKTGALATLLAGGAPYASLVNLSAGRGGMPLFLFSRLALHTQNLARDPRASLLLRKDCMSDGDPLAGIRVSLIGTVAPLAGDNLRTRFLAAHPEAETYIDFADFGFYAMAIERAHLIAGFGRIVDIPGTEILEA